MTKDPAPQKRSSLRIFVLFCGIVLLLVLGSLSVKLFQSVKDGVYDSRQNFIVSVYSPGRVDVFGVNPKEKEQSTLRVTVDTKKYGQVLTGKHLGVASDASITLTKSHDTPQLASLLPALIWFHEPYKSSMTWLDMVRLLLTVGPIQESSRKDVSIAYSDPPSETEYSGYFIDPRITDENVSIGIVNATGQAGIGKRLERVLSSLGGSVVSVTTASTPQEHSSISYYNSGEYTLKRLGKLLKFPMNGAAEEGVSDIIIVVGEDSLSQEVF